MVAALTWGKHLRDLRDARKLTQQQVADAIEVKRETVNQWESESRQLKGEQVIKLADFFGVTCDEVLRGVAAENANFHLQTGLSNKAIDHLKIWESKRERNPPRMARARTHYETVLGFINMLICSSHIEQLAEHVMDYRHRLNGVVENLNYLIANPDSIERTPDPETGDPPNYEIFIGIDDMELYGYKAKELFGEIMEHYAEHKKYEVRQLQEKLSELVGRDYQIWKARDTDGTH